MCDKKSFIYITYFFIFLPTGVIFNLKVVNQFFFNNAYDILYVVRELWWWETKLKPLMLNFNHKTNHSYRKYAMLFVLCIVLCIESPASKNMNMLRPCSFCRGFNQSQLLSNSS